MSKFSVEKKIGFVENSGKRDSNKHFHSSFMNVLNCFTILSVCLRNFQNKITTQNVYIES